jgi:hypothetical protein
MTGLFFQQGVELAGGGLPKVDDIHRRMGRGGCRAGSMIADSLSA